MAMLPLIYAPNPIFKQKAEPVTAVNDAVKQQLNDLLETLYHEQGVGIAAPMVGVLSQLIVIDLQENGEKAPLFIVNPVITERSAEDQTIEEASLCFPGISAPVKRSARITVDYLDQDGQKQQLTAESFFAQVIQHEIDYLHGKVFLDYLSPLKREMLVKKMEKFKKNWQRSYEQHVHTDACNH